MTTYKNDPKWIVAGWQIKCDECEVWIDKGKNIFYYPTGKHVYCEDCGESRSNEFECQKIDEYNYNN